MISSVSKVVDHVTFLHMDYIVQWHTCNIAIIHE